MRPVPDDIPKSADAAAKRASAKRIDEYLAAVGVASWSEVFGDARLAAMHLLGPDADELAIKRLTDRAKSDELKPVREAHTAYHARLAAHARTLSLLAAIKLTGSVPAQSIAMHTKLLHTIAEELGGSDAAFSELILELTIEEAA